MAKEVNSKILLEFIELIPTLEPVEFLGLAKVLCTPTVDKNMESRPFEDIFSDMIDRFLSTGRRQRKDIIKILKNANKEKLKDYGDATENKN